MENICLNCANLDWKNGVSVPYYDDHGVMNFTRAFPCKVSANIVDAPMSYALMSPEASCEDGFEMCETMQELHDTMQDIDKFNGVTAGIDYPATL